MAVRIQFRRGTSTEWSAANPVLAEGELGYESDTKIIKFGDGLTAWSTLPVAAAGDITAVIAGTGLTGGATSGQATLAIDPSYVITADAINAIGDLIVGAGPDTYARLPIGAPGSVLVADPAQSVGVRWAAASSSSGAVVPTGTILPFAGTATSGVELPGGFFLCDGSAVSRSVYSALFGVISSTYGAGDGSSTFNLPDLRGRAPVGYSAGDTGTDSFGAMGAKVGNKTTTLVGGTAGANEVQVPSHAHAVSFTAGGGTHDHTGVSTGNQDANHSHSVSVTGGLHKHTIQFYDIGGSGAGFGTGPIGLNNGGSLQSNVADSTSHSHSTTVGNQSTNHGHPINITGSGTHSHSATITNTLPTSSTMSRVQPSLVVNYIIKT